MSKRKPDKLPKIVRPTKPTMVYDGMCGFCKFWIRRWKQLTKEGIDYISFQDCGNKFSPLSEKEYQSSVYLIHPDGTVLYGAEAVFSSLSSNYWFRWLIWIYKNIGIFRSISELGYSFIANHRLYLSKLTKFFWGNNIELPSYHFSRWIFVKLLGVIYFIAFTSFWLQWEGLVGANGILPVTDFFEQVKTRFGSSGFFRAPSLQWFFSDFGGMNFICISGIVISVMAVIGLLPRISMVVLWILYLSVYTGGQRFLSFQWDVLLLESGFLAIWLAPNCMLFRKHDSHTLSTGCVFLLRWLLFRLMFFSGVTKIVSGDPVWTDLTALTYHYETQPLATWTAWYMHQLPVWFHQLSTGFMFFVELVIPFFIFGPRRIKLIAWFYISLLMILIILTGNYTFFNLLTLILCIFLLDDSVLKKWFKNRVNFRTLHQTSSIKWTSIKRRVAFIFIFCIVILSSAHTSIRYFPDFKFPQFIQQSLQTIRPFGIVNTYGLFSVMTTSRPELVIEKSQNGVDWEEIRFKWKAGMEISPPSFVQPHQPRLDWQMWFAALFFEQVDEIYWQMNTNEPESFQDHAAFMNRLRIPSGYHWFYRFLKQILKGSPAVLELLDNEFETPKYLKVWLYTYQFSDLKVKEKSGEWWVKNQKRILIPEFSLADIQ